MDCTRWCQLHRDDDTGRGRFFRPPVGNLERAQLGRLADQSIGHLDEEPEVLAHYPKSFDDQARLHLAHRPVLGGWPRFSILVPNSDLSLSRKIHLSPQVFVPLLGGLQSRSESLSNLRFRASLPQVHLGVARDFLEDPSFELFNIVFDF